MDNCSGHTMTEEIRAALSDMNTEIPFLPKNATDLCQPTDFFIIQKLKLHSAINGMLKRSEWWKKMWTSPHTGSGKLLNLGKRFFLKLTADITRDIGSKRDKEGLNYCRKAMIRCGMARNLNGIWEERQLFPHLQEIIKRYRSKFDGEEVTASPDLAARQQRQILNRKHLCESLYFCLVPTQE